MAQFCRYLVNNSLKLNHESIRAYCLEKEDAEESFPFGESTLVFKVGGKIFALMALDSNPPEMNLKCDPDLAIELREKFACVVPGYHMNKKHWNTVICDRSATSNEIKKWIDHSYELIKRSLPSVKKAQSVKKK